MPQPAPTPDRPFPLSEAATGAALRVTGLAAPAAAGAIDGQAARLAELGFLPGEPARVLRRAFGGDPLQVRVGASTFALRRAEAAGVLVEGWAEDAS
jgi:ferrous iron transport protein A